MMAGDKTVFDSGKTVLESDKTVYEADKTVNEGGQTVPEGDAAHVSLCETVFSKGERILDTYRVESAAIESGGMGCVWRVHHSGWNVGLAMKQPRPPILK